MPAGDKIVCGFLECIGTASQSFQASGTVCNILLDRTGRNPLANRVQQIGGLRRALFDIRQQIPAVVRLRWQGNSGLNEESTAVALTGRFGVNPFPSAKSANLVFREQHPGLFKAGAPNNRSFQRLARFGPVGQDRAECENSCTGAGCRFGLLVRVDQRTQLGLCGAVDAVGEQIPQSIQQFHSNLARAGVEQLRLPDESKAVPAGPGVRK